MREKLIYAFSIVAMVLIAWDLSHLHGAADEASQGLIYCIIYFHVPAASTGMVGFFVARR